MGLKSKLRSAGRYVSSSVTGKGRVKEYKLSNAELEKKRKSYEQIEEKRGKGAAQRELKIMLESNDVRGKTNKTIKGKIDALVRSERTLYKAKNMKGETRDFKDKAKAEKWAKGTKFASGPSEVSKAKATPETKDFQKTAGSKATVGLDVVKPRTRSQAKEATTEKIFTKKEVDAKPVTASTDGAPRAKSEEVKIDGEIKTSGKTSEVKQERSRRDPTRTSRGRRDESWKKSYKRFVPFTEARRKAKLDKRLRNVRKAEEEEAVASREDTLNIERTRRRAELAEAKARKSEADRFKRGYI